MFPPLFFPFISPAGEGAWVGRRFKTFSGLFFRNRGLFARAGGRAFFFHLSHYHRRARNVSARAGVAAAQQGAFKSEEGGERERAKELPFFGALGASPPVSFHL